MEREVCNEVIVFSHIYKALCSLEMHILGGCLQREVKCETPFSYPEITSLKLKFEIYETSRQFFHSSYLLRNVCNI